MWEKAYRELLDKVGRGSKCVLLTYLDMENERSGIIVDKQVVAAEELGRINGFWEGNIGERLCACLETGKPELVYTKASKAILLEPFMPKPRLFVFGGGHISKPLTEYASKVGFAVTVIDDRPFFANIERFPEADKVICESFERCFDLIDLRETDYAVIVTRGHRYDGTVLRQVLKHDLGYMGMIGSKRRVSAMMEELRGEGYDPQKLDLVHAPIGLDIAAITPEEIAVSIIAQLIHCKNRPIMNKLGKGFTFPELDAEVAKHAAEETEQPKALLTIIGSKGSVPRKAGAKMVAYYDGRTVGSIGGGCSEAAVIAWARQLMLEQGPRVLTQHVDLTGEAAEEEGMVCGGVMEVLVEVL